MATFLLVGPKNSLVVDLRGAIDDAQGAVDQLSSASAYLDYAKYVPEFDEFAGRIGQIQKGIGAVSSKLGVANNVCIGVKSLATIYEGIEILDSIGEISQDPEAAAQAFGMVLSGIGELAQFLPPPASSYLVIFRDARDFFVNIRRQRMPEVHMREKGVREMIDQMP